MKKYNKSVLPGFALSGISVAMLSAPVQAITFGSGDFRGAFNSTLSVGASWRMEGTDGDLVSPGNTGRPSNVGASASVTDDGNLNYGNGDLTSLVFKGLHDLDLSYKNFGVFTRFKYWYDYALVERDVPHGNIPNGYIPNEPLSDDGFSRLGSFKGIALLDAYLYYSFNAGSVPIDLRLGRQVVNWGESTFIQNGINVINPVDVTALRRPGAELKEALLPVGMVSGSFGLTNNLSLEAFYQFEWARTEIDSCGTFFSAGDAVNEGCDRLTLLNYLPDSEMLAGPIDLDTSLGPLSVPGTVKRAEDSEPRNGGQWGVSLKYFAESLASTEFGFYFINYHWRLPNIIGGINGNLDTAPLGVPILNADPANLPTYQVQFPEDINLYGLSFNTNVAGWSVGGELSYRPNMPLDINTTHTLHGFVFGKGATWSTQLDRALEAGNYGTVDGYDEVNFTQLQFTLIKQYFNFMGAGSFTLVGEIGGNYINGQDDDQRYGRSPTFGIGYFEPYTDPTPITGGDISCPDGPVIPPNEVSTNCTNRGYVTDYAWGYRLRGVWKYSSVFAGINLTPGIAWSHDVEGYSPAPNFTQGSKALGLSLKADYLSRYSMDLSYNMFFDGDYSTVRDRDFIALSFGVSF